VGEAALRTLYELAATWETLHRRVEKGALTEADMTAQLAPLVGVDERGRRWTVSLAGQWTEVGATGEPVASGAPKAKDPTTSRSGEAALRAALKELESLVGLAVVKRQVKELTALVRVQKMRRAAGLPVAVMSYHLVFRGNPGTGKTTVARLIGRIYAALEVVPTGQVVETDRAGLVAEYVGQTAIKTSAAFEKARGGILFIDEAYALARDAGSASGFGQEAIDTLVKLMEDHRDQVAVIVAGYTGEMAGFLAANPGLASRFAKTIEFEDYTPADLLEIVQRMAAEGDYRLEADTEPLLLSHFDRIAGSPGFGNARDARRSFEGARKAQSQRLRALGRMPETAELRTLTAADVRTATS
jgi:SpoVK/Ycf46/Vps4 family AAA+-type ATPase